GEEGAQRFLRYKYGLQSAKMKEYLDSKEDYDRFTNHILHGATVLDSLYKSFTAATDSLTKEKEKRKIILQIVTSLDTVSFHDTARYHSLFSEKHLPNNAFF